jgi:hypothetical protein
MTMKFCLTKTLGANRRGISALLATMIVTGTIIDAKASCEAEKANFEARQLELHQSRLAAHVSCDEYDFITRQKRTPPPVCTKYAEAMNARNNCQEKEEQKKKAAERAKQEAISAASAKKDEERRAVFMRSWSTFTDALKIGMTAGEVMNTETEAFHNPGGWGRKVNTSVYASGIHEQWVYSFARSYPVNDVSISRTACLLPFRNRCEPLKTHSFLAGRQELQFSLRSRIRPGRRQ